MCGTTVLGGWLKYLKRVNVALDSEIIRYIDKSND